MSFTAAVRTCLRRYATFSGRARRSEFWWFFLASNLVVVAMYAVGLLAVAFGSDPQTGDPSGPVGVGGLVVVLLLLLVLLGLTLPYIAVAVRRLHDTGLTGWLYLLTLVPFGGVVLLVLWARQGTPGPNQHGPDPRLPHGAADLTPPGAPAWGPQAP